MQAIRSAINGKVDLRTRCVPKLARIGRKGFHAKCSGRLKGSDVSDDRGLSTSDRQLLEKFLAGDVEAFERLVDRYQAPILTLARRMTGDPGLAEDLFQEIFFKAYRSAHELRDPGRFRGWLFTLGVRHIRRALVKRGRRRTQELEEDLVAEIDPDRTEREEALGSLGQAVERLPPKQREVVLLRSFEGLSYADIAAVTRSTEETARANYYQGLKRLKGWHGENKER